MYRLISGIAVVTVLALTGSARNATLKELPNGRGVTPMSQELWTASDKPYKAIEAHMRAEFAAGKSDEALVEEYKLYALQHPHDPVAQFALVYAERGKAITQSGGLVVPEELVTQLAGADPGNVHEYTRYRYCMSQEANLQLPIDEVVTVGDRLLHYNPQDEWVKINMIYLLVDTKQGIQLALPRALEWVKQQPDSAKAHSTLALVYEDLWASDKKYHLPDAYKAIAEYKAYLRLAKPDDPFRKQAQYLITTIGNQAESQ